MNLWMTMVTILVIYLPENTRPAKQSSKDLRNLLLVFVRKLVKLLFDFVDIGLNNVADDFKAKFLWSGLLILHHPLFDPLLGCNVTRNGIASHFQVNNRCRIATFQQILQFQIVFPWMHFHFLVNLWRLWHLRLLSFFKYVRLAL